MGNLWERESRRPRYIVYGDILVPTWKIVHTFELLHSFPFNSVSFTPEHLGKLHLKRNHFQFGLLSRTLTKLMQHVGCICYKKVVLGGTIRKKEKDGNPISWHRWCSYICEGQKCKREGISHVVHVPSVLLGSFIKSLCSTTLLLCG